MTIFVREVCEGTVLVGIEAGADLTTAKSAMHTMADEQNKTVVGRFNGVEIEAKPGCGLEDSNAETAEVLAADPNVGLLSKLKF